MKIRSTKAFREAVDAAFETQKTRDEAEGEVRLRPRWRYRRAEGQATFCRKVR